MPLIFMHLSSLCLMSAYLNGASAKQQPLSIKATKTLALQKLSFVHSLFLHSETDGIGKSAISWRGAARVCFFLSAIPMPRH